MFNMKKRRFTQIAGHDVFLKCVLHLSFIIIYSLLSLLLTLSLFQALHSSGVLVIAGCPLFIIKLNVKSVFYAPYTTAAV